MYQPFSLAAAILVLLLAGASSATSVYKPQRTLDKRRNDRANRFIHARRRRRRTQAAATEDTPTEIVEAKKLRQAQREEERLSERSAVIGEEGRSFSRNSAADAEVIFLDLFAVPCDESDLTSICTTYVSEGLLRFFLLSF